VALEAFPALAESRDRLLSVLSNKRYNSAEVISVVESDVALVAGVLRLASKESKRRGCVETVAGAIELLPPATLKALAGSVRTFDFFEDAGVWHSLPERFRSHALATKRAADWIASDVGYLHRDRLAAASLLHDIGKAVLAYAYRGYPHVVHQGARTAEERIYRERRELGLDHAVVGGVLVRRWRLSGSLAGAIEHHHDPDAAGEAAIIRLADMIAHYEEGTSVDAKAMLQSARAVGLDAGALRQVLYGLPGSDREERVHCVDPSPLSDREYAVLVQLANGSVYGEIGRELGISTSTVRSHLHKIYAKLGVIDRAQAVLIASRSGWLPVTAWAPRPPT
jgi:putative nucleotidyltransferase with HDIG domain